MRRHGGPPQQGVKALVAIVLVMDLLAIWTVTGGKPVAWINEFKKSSCTNPFWTKGFTVYGDGESFEIGFRGDGVMVWRHNPKK